MSEAVAFGRRRSVIVRYAKRFDGAEVTRWAVRGLLIGAIVALTLNLRDISIQKGLLPQWASFAADTEGPLLPPVNRASLRNGTVDPRGSLQTDQAALDRDLQFTQEAGGVLRATGRIVQGSAEAFADKLASEPVRLVVIDSPGGSLEDAMAMGRLARERRLATEVKDGGVCASSCPLFLAGGVERTVGAKAAIGLHQFYATTGAGNGVAAALSSAQATAARIGHHLVAMGVDPALWLHAFDTPPQTLYYLTPGQQAHYRLTTGDRNVVATAGN